MALSNDISVRLDASTLVQAFLSELGARNSALSAITAPNPDTGAISTTAAAFDADSLTPLIGNLVQQAGAGLSAIVPQADVLGRITAALELVEQVTTGDLPAQIEALIGQLSAELEGSREGGTFGVLLRLSRLLSQSPQGGALLSLLQSLLNSAGVSVPGAVREVPAIVPALDSLVRAVGGLMMLESVLAESERLTTLMAQRLDAGAVQRSTDQLLAMMTPELVARIAAADISDDAALQALGDTLAVVANRIGVVSEEIAAGMGLGEATLAYLNVGQVQSEVEAAAALLRNIDLDPIERQLRAALGGLQPFLALDFSRAPAQSLEALLSQAEAQIATVAGQINAFDPATLTAPLQQGIDTLTAPLRDLSAVIEQVLVSIRSALETVKRVVVELPVGELARAITTLLEPITRVLQLITDVVAEVAAALETAAGEAVTALGQVEGVVDDFKAQVQALFADARAFIEGLNLDAVVGSLSGRIAEFTEALGQAQLKPYFDTAADAIDSATDVVSAVPFGLLPESMKADVDAAVAPIKAVDLVAFEVQVESMVGIGPDGSFTPRADLEAALLTIQEKFDALVAVLREHDPEQYLAQLDEKLAELAAKVREIAPAVTLQPVQDAIDQVKTALAGFDLEQQLQPLQQVFDQAIAAMQAYSPAQLIVPVEERVTQARQKLIDAIRLDTWSPALDRVHELALQALDLIDPAQLESKLTELLTEARGLSANLPSISPQWIGTIVAALHRGSMARIHSHTYPAVQQWIDQRSGADALTARTAAIADAVATTHAAVAGIDVASVAGTMTARLQPIRSALASLQASLPGDSRHRSRFASLSLQLDVQADLGRLAANRDHYLTLLAAALPLGETLRRTGLSEVNGVIEKLHRAFEPVRTLLGTLRAFVRATGLTQVDAGVPQMLQALFDAAPPARLAGMTAPIFVALRGRVLALVDAVINPVKDAIAQLQALIAAIDLAPLRQAVDEVFQSAVAEVQALSPATLLAAPIGSVNALKAQVAAFDPLHALLTVLNALRDTVARVLEKLSAQQLLADPVAIYREIVDALDALNVQALMTPVLDLLDSIAKDVDEGLDNTVTAFERLQDALPAGGGGSSVSVEVTV